MTSSTMKSSSNGSETIPLTCNGGASTLNYGTDDVIVTNATTDTTKSPPTATTSIVSHAGSIGMWGSMAIAVNSLTGPAMLDLPATFQRSGLIPTTIALIFVCILSSLCSLHMANTISKVPGNLNFSKEVEFSSAFRYFWG